jgi:uncharacterized protein
LLFLHCLKADMDSTQLHPQTKRRVDAVVTQLLDDVHGIKAAVVSTADGFELSAVVFNAAQTSRLAAMASSISALGVVVGEESKLGECKSILIEAQEGFLVVISAPSPSLPMTLSLIAGSDAVVGQVLHYGKLAATQLATLEAVP